eukprot:7928336-Prorocentrum_lima.AAC.1
MFAAGSGHSSTLPRPLPSILHPSLWPQAGVVAAAVGPPVSASVVGVGAAVIGPPVGAFVVGAAAVRAP